MSKFKIGDRVKLSGVDRCGYVIRVTTDFYLIEDSKFPVSEGFLSYKLPEKELEFFDKPKRNYTYRELLKLMEENDKVI